MSTPTTTTSTPVLWTADQIGEAIGVGGETVLRWHRTGIIPASVSEGRIVRFDLVIVKAALRRRAKERDAMRPPVDMMKVMVPVI